MVSFARARTKSWLSKLWPIAVQQITNETTNLNESKDLIKKQQEQNKYIFEALKNGGIWFS